MAVSPDPESALLRIRAPAKATVASSPAVEEAQGASLLRLVTGCVTLLANAKVSCLSRSV